MIVWYLCPYDTIKETEGSSLPRFIRVPGIARYIPSVPNADRADWSEIEILGNAILVKVSAPAALHTTIQADGDFQEIPHIGVIPPNQRSGIRSYLLNLGYTRNELDATGWNAGALLRFLASEVNVVTLDRPAEAYVVTAARRGPSKPFTKIDERVPG